MAFLIKNKKMFISNTMGMSIHVTGNHLLCKELLILGDSALPESKNLNTYLNLKTYDALFYENVD